MNQLEWNELMVEIEQYIFKLDKASKSVGELFYESIGPETIQIFTQYLTGFYDISQAIAAAVENSEHYAPNLKAKAEPHVLELFKQFEQMKLLLSQERLVSLGDIMKFEIPEILQRILNALKE